ncbi:hypothetical protein [Candidatus Neptunichlamydia sp. REUL1]|uniref:hypothetical protein n=1 Tax=Candidatus Neptunichlamydia sp. REUL1 TaxID=3064277 RepID=UPI00292E5D37|nr:hypothetical protein [Candidatus Neptunochlamydia sp. REUL1]
MQNVQKIFYKLDNDVAIASLFFATAYFAGSKRFVEVFPTANRQGLMFAAATSSLGLGISQQLTNHIGLKKKKTLVYKPLVKSLVVAATALITTPWVAKTFGREAKILSQDVTKFARVTTGVIVGAHCTRYLRSMPGKDVNLDKLESDIRILEAVPRSEWRISDGVNAFNPDKILDTVGDDNVICEGVGEDQALYKSLFTLDGEATVSDSVQRAVTYRINEYSAWNKRFSREKEVKWYLNKILLYMLTKKTAYESDPYKTVKKRDELKALIDKVMVRIEDAHRECTDQQTTQLEWLIIEIVNDFGLSEIEKLIAIELRKYRKALIEKCIAVTDEKHAADLGVDLTNSITRDLGLPIIRATKHSALCKIYKPVNFQNAKASFFSQYDPVGFLVEQTNYSQSRKAFSELSQWFRDNVFTDEKREAKFEELLGADFLNSFERKDAAVLYYLFKNGLVTVW